MFCFQIFTTFCKMYTNVDSANGVCHGKWQIGEKHLAMTDKIGYGQPVLIILAHPCSLTRIYTVACSIFILFLILISLKLKKINDSSKNGRWIILFQKCSTLRVNIDMLMNSLMNYTNHQYIQP